MTPLVVLLAVATVQVALLLHVRATLVSAAAEAARASSLAGAAEAMGERRARDIVSDVMGGAELRAVDVRRQTVDGLPVVVVRLQARVPLVGLLPAVELTVEGRALVEGWVA